MRKTWIAMALAGALGIASPLAAETYLSLKDALKLLLPAGQKYFKLDISLTEDQAKTLNTKWDNGGFSKGDPFTLYYAKDESGKVTGMAMEMTEILLKYSASHTWVIGVGPDLRLTGVSMVEITNDHAYGLSSKAFQAQFAGKDPAALRLGKGVDAVSGATDSSQLLIDSAQKVLYLISQYPPK